MSREKRSRRQFTTEQTAAILRRHLVDPVSEPLRTSRDPHGCPYPIENTRNPGCPRMSQAVASPSHGGVSGSSPVAPTERGRRRGSDDHATFHWAYWSTGRGTGITGGPMENLAAGLSAGRCAAAGRPIAGRREADPTQDRC